MAAIQPWSAAGAEKPMVTVSPASSLPPSAAAGAESEELSSSLAGVLGAAGAGGEGQDGDRADHEAGVAAALLP